MKKTLLTTHRSCTFCTKTMRRASIDEILRNSWASLLLDTCHNS